MEIKTSEPLPCPFCGNSLVKRGDWGIYDHKPSDCILDDSSIVEKHLGEWNRRAEPVPDELEG